jgi:hypothetical protein
VFDEVKVWWQQQPMLVFSSLALSLWFLLLLVVVFG